MLPSLSPETVAAWPAPNYVNPDTRKPLVFGVGIPLMVLVIIFVSMRFYSRAIIVKALGSDDWVMLAAAVTSVATSILICISMGPKFQTGYHLWDINPQVNADSSPTAQCMFVPVTALTKVSVLLTYLRIFPSKTNKWFCYFMLAFTAAWAITTFCLALFQCTPIEAYWKPFQYPEVVCIPVTVIYYTTGGLNICSDFTIFLWPAKDLAKIQISVKQRATLIVMFSIGLVICIAGVCRVWYTSVYVTSYDVLFNGATLYAITIIETSLGVICGCLPACKPLMSMMLPHIFVSTHNSTSKTGPRKATKTDGSIPLSSLSGGIVKSAAYSVQFDDALSDFQSGYTRSNIRSNRLDPDQISAGSEEWIMMNDSPMDLRGQRGKSNV